MWAAIAARILSRAGENMSAVISSIRARVAMKVRQRPLNRVPIRAPAPVKCNRAAHQG